MFNVQVPLPQRGEVFLMNTMSDSQVIVTPDVIELLERAGMHPDDYTEVERETLDELRRNGFVVESPEQERRDLAKYFEAMREDDDQLRVTVLTTLQCNFACDYCFQGDHGDHNKFAHKMSLDTAARVVDWIEARLDEIRPRRLDLMLFGGEPLLNLPVAYYLAERCHALCQARGIRQKLGIITNGLLLSEDIVDRLNPFGLNGIKVTLDGDRDTHDRMRPLRGGQGTFDRIIDNVRKVAHKTFITIGGNFDESSVESYPALLDFLREQTFAGDLGMVNFKPVMRAPRPEAPKGLIPLTAIGDGGRPLGGTCMTGAGAGMGASSGSACDTCHFADEALGYLRNETRRRGFPTPDGVHMGPCEIHRRHAHTLGPDGAIYHCPGFTGEPSLSTGHIDGRDESWRAAARDPFEALSPWKEECGDCSFIPVCGGGCSVAAHTELGDMHAPSCHKGALESALVNLAHDAAASHA
jgi:uncharacterized protein